jgi:hypothetical protein
MLRGAHIFSESFENDLRAAGVIAASNLGKWRGCCPSEACSPGKVGGSGMTISARLIARSTQVMMSSTTHSWAPTRSPRITAGFGMPCNSRSRSSISSARRRVTISPSDIHRRVAPGARTGPACFRSARGGLGSSCPASGSRAPLCSSRGQGAAASGIVPRCGPHGLRRTVRDLPSTGASAARCRSHRHGCGRAIRTADRVEWATAIEDPPCRLRCPPDWRRPRLPNSRLRSSSRNPRWPIPRTRAEEDPRNIDRQAQTA